ncbi:MAG: phosphate/phosphite/phosphonate ABC transporter substrate-binding protein [Actinobacteria bacterium]|nr:phosphate/phosphite/phosphonate ABC transporter substrate-binding protein [Actinomycetota bacterium]
MTDAPAPAALTFTVSPDFNVRQLPGWYVVNTWLQRHTGDAIHLQTFDDFGALHQALDSGRVDLIYANAFDAARLVRDQGYIPLARPHGRPDEAVVAVNASSAVHEVEQLTTGTRVATTDNPDVHMMGMIMIEPADLGPATVQISRCPNFVLVAKALLYDEADIGFFLAETFDELSSTIRNQLRVLVRSEIFVISHLFLVHPRLAHRADALRRSLLLMDAEDKGRAALDDVGIERWDAVEQEEVEFMIDLMAALTQ